MFTISPEPKVALKNNSTTINSFSSVMYFGPVSADVTIFAELMKLDFSQTTEKEANLIVKVDAKLENELKVQTSDKAITITVKDLSNLHFALGKVRQMIYFYDFTFPNAVSFADDLPYYPYRGFHLDCSRHFFPLEGVKKLLSLASMFEYNYFHWHLTDDQGWRFEVPGYPRTKTVASKRICAEEVLYTHEGLYTREDMKEIVELAAALHITVIPEIETPGHAQALLAAYPEFGCTGNKVEVQNQWGIFEDVMNPASEELMVFLEAAIKELVSIFPGEFLHIGGDECPHVQWETNEECQALMKKEGIKSTEDLQGWFTAKVANMVTKHGKTAMGWDEVLMSENIPTDMVIMSWRGQEGGIEASKRGHRVIMCPEKGGCYFDRSITTSPLEAGNLTVNTVSRIMNFDIVPEEIPQYKAHLVIGAQGNLWAEFVTSFRMVEYMFFPRMAILAEKLKAKDSITFEEVKKKRKCLMRMMQNADTLCYPGEWT